MEAPIAAHDGIETLTPFSAAEGALWDALADVAARLRVPAALAAPASPVMPAGAMPYCCFTSAENGRGSLDGAHTHLERVGMALSGRARGPDGSLGEGTAAAFEGLA